MRDFLKEMFQTVKHIEITSREWLIVEFSGKIEIVSNISYILLS